MPATSPFDLLAGRDGQAEVGDARAAAAVDHHVGRLQVAVQHASVVRRGEPRAELPRDLERLVLRKPADPLQQRGEILAVDVLHRQEVLAVDLADVVDAADVGMRDLARDAHLGVEALERASGSDASRSRQELQRDRLAELQVVGAVDLAHAAAPEQADDAVALGEDVPGVKPPASIESDEASRPTSRGGPPPRRLRDRGRREIVGKLRRRGDEAAATGHAAASSTSVPHWGQRTPREIVSRSGGGFAERHRF